jgi:hypothetical protein
VSRRVEPCEEASPVQPHRLTRLLGVAFLVAVSSPAAAAFRCDSTTALTVVGIDTEAERVLFALPQTVDVPGWLVEADMRAGAARAWPEEKPAARFGGSSGPGAVLAATRCGDHCLQVVRFRAGTWQPLGEPLLVSDATTLHLTWDRAGAPWVVMHALSGPYAVEATAYRLEGSDWLSKGALRVRAVGHPGAAPAPPGEEGVTSGDGLFSTAAAPRRWIEALPELEDTHGGQLLWLGGSEAAHLGGDGKLRRTADGGASWQPLRWQPSSGGEGDPSWRTGRDYWIELPDGERGPPLATLWDDRRVADNGALFLAGQTAEGGWGVLLATPQGILTEGGQRLPYNHVARFAGERWVLATGCVARQGGAALAIRRFADGTLGEPELLAVAVPPAAGSLPPE